MLPYNMASGALAVGDLIGLLHRSRDGMQKVHPHSPLCKDTGGFFLKDAVVPLLLTAFGKTVPLINEETRAATRPSASRLGGSTD